MNGAVRWLTGTPGLAERKLTVWAEDGVSLAVRECGPTDAPVTVVLLHGHCLGTESWSPVSGDLMRRNADVRIVCYDHRGHGDSAEAPAQTYTLEQLARDLHIVLRAVAPTGPVVLIGHSMGGMTVLTYARAHPDEIGTRIVGVGLIATTASGLADAGLGRLLRNPVLSWFQAAVGRAPTSLEQVKRLGCRVFAPVIGGVEFGNRTVSHRVLAQAIAMHDRTPIVTMTGFLNSILTHDESRTVPALSAVPTLVLCGSADLVIPPTHAVAIAAHLENCDFVCVDGAGHSVILEQPTPVADAIARLMTRVSAAGTAAAHVA
ncbi:Pimeloyl-ACP methyl ester carboxylesterase [Rhodococcus koreensis]|uniref:Pimeloyl-ACP methyl ester carboxylesterase n=1 Tax=Rhodococcus koreensis TaxID=99653 RepID=A0A1H4M0N6_9NOCA|nr:alpha/beta hydrolase [Rhodococcus koreensis]SEB76591.1 Pimeloyl-ACP methyl ester carboxylesterase [Rhodococcus koreensis]